MQIKTTLYRLAFTLARAAVIGAHAVRWHPPTNTDSMKDQYEHTMYRDDEGRPTLSGVGGGGHGPTSLLSARRGEPGRRQNR